MAAIHRVSLVDRSMPAVLSDRDRLRQRAARGEELAQPPQDQSRADGKPPIQRARVKPPARTKRPAKRHGWVRDREGTLQHRESPPRPVFEQARPMRIMFVIDRTFKAVRRWRRRPGGGMCGAIDSIPACRVGDFGGRRMTQSLPPGAFARAVARPISGGRICPATDGPHRRLTCQREF
jgi:hypothetical protein